MKIAVSSQGETRDSQFEPRFGRAGFFALVDDVSGEIDFLNNSQQLDAMQGAGIQSARNVAETGAKVVITGHVGPKAFSALNAAEIKIFTLEGQWTLTQVIEKYKKGELASVVKADVDGHWV